MLMNKKGLVTALLCVVLVILGLSGCAKDGPLYTTGFVAQTESESEEDAEEAESEPEVTGGADSSGVSDSTAASSGALGTLAGLDTGTESVSGTAKTQTEAVMGYVYVCGAVKEPGVYPITADMRVCDAVALAGGFSSEADEEWLNQAAVVSDGQKLYIYTMEETELMRASGMSAEGVSDTADATVSVSTGGASATGTAGSDGMVNLNTATRDELMTLPGIGESKADAIIAYRDAHGAFASIEEIQNISGIKDGVFSQIKDLITV